MTDPGVTRVLIDAAYADDPDQSVMVAVVNAYRVAHVVERPYVLNDWRTEKLPWWPPRGGDEEQELIIRFEAPALNVTGTVRSTVPRRRRYEHGGAILTELKWTIRRCVE